MAMVKRAEKLKIQLTKSNAVIEDIARQIQLLEKGVAPHDLEKANG